MPVLQGDYSQELKEVLKSCMNLQPWDRPQAEALERMATNAINNMDSQPSPISVHTERSAFTPQHSSLTPQRRKFNVWWIAGLAMALVLVGGLGYLFLKQHNADNTTVDVERSESYETAMQSHPDEPEVDVQRPTSSVEASDLEEADSKVSEEEMSDSKASEVEVFEEEVSGEAPPAKTNTNDVERTTSAARHAKPNTQRTTSETQHPTSTKETSDTGLHDLGYATWQGELKNGKPNGFGTMTFKSDYNIGKGRTAHAGDRLTDCEYHDGKLYQGKWQKANGDVELSLP